MPRRNRYNPYYNQDRMTLNTVGFTPAVFNPIEFQPVEADYRILDAAMAKQEARQKEAVEQTNAVRIALGKAREELHRDPETLSWFDNKATEIENKLNTAAQVGDFAGAINLAVQEAGNLATDTELTARIRNNKEYEARMQQLEDMVNKGFINNSTANYIRKQNPYENRFVKDANNNIVGSEEWNFKKQPVRDLDINKLFEESFKSITPDRTSNQKQTNLQKSASDTTPVYKRSGSISNISEMHSSNVIKVSPQEIIEQAQRRLFASPDWEQQLDQLYGGAWQQYQDNEAKLATLDENSQEYKQLSTVVDWQRQLFYTDGVPNKKDTNTYLNFFNRQLFTSDQAKAYGYTITDYNNSYTGSVPTKKGTSGAEYTETVLDALSREAQNNEQVRMFLDREFGVGLW